MTSWFSQDEKKALRIIVFITIVMRLALMFRSEERIFTRPFTEDSFYLFSTAEHFAKGEGFSVDGVQPTNGVQPLIIFFYGPLFLIAGFNKLLVLKLAFVWIALFDAISAVLLAALIKKMMRREEGYSSTWLSPPIIAALLWGTLYPIYVHTACGLETGLSSTLMIASVLVYADILLQRSKGIDISISKLAALGLLLGLTVLARIDAGILVAIICSLEIWNEKVKGLRSALITGAVSVIISLPWWWYNYSVFGHVMPQSGFAESLVDETSRNIWQAITVIVDSFSVFFFLPKAIDVSNVITLLWTAFVVGGIYWLLKLTKAWQVAHMYYLKPLQPLALTSMVFSIYYVFFFSAPHFIPRYFQPYRILALILAAIMLPIMIQYFLSSKPKRMLMYSAIAVAFLFSYVRYGYYFTITDYSDFYLTGKWAGKTPDIRVGMDQSGTAGFVAANVVNLDGKVNISALRARQKNDIGEYLAKERLEYIADWQEKVDEITTSAKRYGLVYAPFDSIGRVRIYKIIK
jgi:hypothetical protein